ncbi:MAG TPA: DUF1223 domain-containing protein [Kiloniellales bacterium]|nr:DUF1223 domain-containing protein [Kiloniellales bacterium]
MSFATPTRRRFLGTLAALAALPRVALAAEQGPVVVELFTSQGCWSCPPADALLGELAGRADIIALAYHVDYWDYIGWQDVFGSPECTRRQQAYADYLGNKMVYTPQMVVGGRIDAMGSNRQKVEAAIVEARKAGVSVTLTPQIDGTERVTVKGPAPPGGATVLAVHFLPQAETVVSRGENAGKTLIEYNIVRELQPLGRFTGGEATYDIIEEDPSGEQRACAVLVQDDATGAILGAVLMPPES